MIAQLELRNDICLVLLAPDPVEERAKASGLVVEQSIPAPICYGRVLRTGPLVSDVAKGDVVAFPPSAGEEYPHRDYRLLFVHEREIAFVVNPKGES